MAFVPIPGTASFQCFYQQQGVPCQNTYYVKSGTAWDLSTLTAMCLVIRTWEFGTAKTWRADSTVALGILARDMSTEAGAELHYTDGYPVHGVHAVAPLPQNCTISVTAETGLAGRSHRGRTYWIGLTTDSCTGGTISDTWASGIGTSLNTLTTAINAVSGAQLVQVSRQEDKVALNPAHTHPIIGWGLADQFMDSQRRRLPGHNRHR